MTAAALALELKRTDDLLQRLAIVETLHDEIHHFKQAMAAIRSLPSSRDDQMPEAYKAYNQLLDAYREMIEVRQNLIEELKKGL